MALSGMDLNNAWIGVVGYIGANYKVNTVASKGIQGVLFLALIYMWVSEKYIHRLTVCTC